MFQDSRSTIEERDCIAAAEKCGIATSDFQVAMNSPETANQLNETINRAYQSGVFGVPTFVVGDELFWGNDRIVLLSHYLKSAIDPIS
jgi:2-hydroxychromene-2-carboxylate isomerase